MGEVTMITAGNPEHPGHIQEGTYGPVEPRGAGPDSPEWNEMDHQKRDLLLEYRLAASFRNQGIGVFHHHEAFKGYKGRVNISENERLGQNLENYRNFEPFTALINRYIKAM